MPYREVKMLEAVKVLQLPCIKKNVESNGFRLELYEISNFDLPGAGAI